MIPELDSQKKEVRALCQKHGVRRLEVFGSAAVASSFTETSDIDFLVEFDHPTQPGYADRFFGLLEDLERLLERPIDLVVDSAITNPYFRQVVDNTKVLVHAR